MGLWVYLKDGEAYQRAIIQQGGRVGGKELAY